MSDRALKAAIDALKKELPKELPINVFARATAGGPREPKDNRRARFEGDRLAPLLDDILRAVEKLNTQHDEASARIDAWQGLPSGSGTAVAEARALAVLVDEEEKAVGRLLHAVERGRRVGVEENRDSAVAGLNALEAELEGWRKASQGDHERLLVAGLTVLEKQVGQNGHGGGAAELPLALQVERALADAAVAREKRDDDERGARMLPSPDERRSVAQRIVRDLDAEIQRQEELSRVVQHALDAARAAGQSPPAELRTATEELRGWGQGLAFEKSRVQSLARQ